MDSLTQIALGAAVGEMVLGKKVGNKAMLYGAVAGTIPDLDVVASYFTDTVSALSIHRGFTHSIAFSVLFAPLFGFLISRFESSKDYKDWSWLFFWAFLTHPLLDAFTNWGTQLFWPFEIRLAFKSIFVIDPLYTMPLLICLVLTMRNKRTSKKRRFYNTLGLGISTSYLLLTLVLKLMTFSKFESALQNQGISYQQIDTRPSALNTILWNANVETENSYLLASYSFFDTKPISFETYPKNHRLLGDLKNNKKVKQMMDISEGWFTISQKTDGLYYNDLRFGLLSLEANSQDFVFQYKIEIDSKGKVNFIETEKFQGDGKKLMEQLWSRLKGN